MELFEDVSLRPLQADDTVECLCKYAFEELQMNRVRLEIRQVAIFRSDLGFNLKAWGVTESYLPMVIL